MKKLLAIAVSSLFVLTGCSYDSTDSQDEPVTGAVSEESPSEVRGDGESEGFPLEEWANLTALRPAENCKVPDGLAENEIGYSKVRGSVGFPFVTERFPHQGSATIVLAQVAFEDMRPAVDETPLEYFSPHAQKLQEWMDFFSQGVLDMEIVIVPNFVEMPMESTELPADLSEVVDMIKGQMPPEIDWPAVDGTFIYWASKINNQLGGQGSLRVGSSEFNFEEGEDREGLFFAAHNWHLENSPGFPFQLKRDYTWGYLLHEIQHEQGLNTHAPGNGWSTGSGQNQYPQPRSGEWSAVLASWEQWLLGWIHDDQVHCALIKDLDTAQRVVLTPQEIYGGNKKIAVVPIEDDKVLVIESRRPINWTEGWDESDSGLMVYTVNPQLREQDDHDPNDCGNSAEYPKWAYYLFPDGKEPKTCQYNDFRRAILRDAGQTLTYEGVRVTLEHSGADLDYLSISAVPEK